MRMCQRRRSLSGESSSAVLSRRVPSVRPDGGVRACPPGKGGFLKGAVWKYKENVCDMKYRDDVFIVIEKVLLSLYSKTG